MEIKTEASLFVGQQYDVLVINYSSGGRCSPSNPVCFPKRLRYDGNDSHNRPIFSEQYFTITNSITSLDFNSGKWRVYNNENWVVVGILPERVIDENDNDYRGVNYWMDLLKITTILQTEE